MLGLLMSHAPNITAKPELVDEARWGRLKGAFDEARRLVVDARPDLIVAFINDHFQNFFLDGMPAFCIGIGEEHPIPSTGAEFLKVRPRIANGQPAVARRLLECLLDAEFDLAYSEELKFFDETAVPLRFLFPEEIELPLVPILTNCVAPPLPSLRRCYKLGRAVGEALVEMSVGRVLVLGSGGMSHWVGTPETGRINEAFDERVLSLIERGHVEEILAWTDKEVERDAGNGAFELRNWVAALGALSAIGRYRARVLAYVPAPEWITGIGVVALTPL